MTTKRTLGSIAGIAVGLALLAGCVPTPSESPSPIASATPTPTPTGSTGAAPTSESEAVTSAEATLTEYLKAYDQVGIDGWTGADRLLDYATQDVYSSDLAGIDASKNEGRSQTGYATLEVLDAQVVDASSGVEYGNVLVRACFDPSTRNVLLADGSAAPLPNPVRSVKEATVTYSADSSKWLVATFVTPPSGREEC